MLTCKYFTLLIIFSGWICSVFSNHGYNGRFESDQSDKDILDILTHPSRYDKRNRPPVGPINVNISVLLLSLSSPDESSLHYEVEFLVHQKWDDPRLAYQLPDGSSKIYLFGLSHSHQVWRPDIYLIKHGSHKTINPEDVNMKVFPNGTIFYTMRRHLVLNCEGDLPIFPFDSPMCSFNIESVSNTRDKLEFHWVGPNAVQDDGESGSMASSPVLKNHNAHLIHNETLFCEGEEWRGDYSCLKVRLHFTRDKWFYYTTVFVPGLILVTSSFVTFWIEWNAEPARVMLGVTTMLNFFTTSNKFRSKLPVVSNLTAMNMWDGVCMFFIYASFLEFILVNYLARWVQDPEQKKQKKDNAILDSLRMVTHTLDLTGQISQVTSMANVTNATTGKQDGSSSPESVESTGTGHSYYTLHNVKKIDNYSRRIFPTLYILFVLYFFIRYHLIEGALSVDYYYSNTD